MIGPFSGRDAASAPVTDMMPPAQAGTTSGGQDQSEAAGQGGLTLSRGRATFVHISLVLFAAAIVARSALIQIVEHDRWQREAERQHVVDVKVAPPRGAIYDATGNVLVETREEMQIIVEPHNLRAVTRKNADGKKRTVDSRVILRKTLKELRVPDAWVKRAYNRKYRWVEMPQRFAPSDVQHLKGLPGVVLRSRLNRVNSTPEGLRGIVGVANAEGSTKSGVERELDVYLRGEAGRDPLVRDGLGGRIGSPMLTSVQAQPGHNVTLTINQQLQEIAEEALANARQRTGATGGDVLILDPRDGAILALAGIRQGKAAYTNNALTEAFEPGSVMKPFVVARLLDLGKVSPEQIFNTYNGTWKYLNKSYTDTHEAEQMSVRDIIRFSSNIGTVQAALRISDREHYRALRDFGFGVPTGVSYPSESRGALTLPPWKGLTQAQIAIGYNVSVTPLQLAVAYAALANGGDVLQPSLVRQVRDVNGKEVFAHKRTVIRRAISPEVSALMREMLKSVVDSGTSTAADMQAFDVGGKSGTARRVKDEGRGYAIGKYNSSFAGMFPVENPQYVIVARLIDPEGTYYGGIVSGTMVNNILQSALATSDASLDRDALARIARPVAAPAPKPRTPEQLRVAARDSARRDSLKAPPPPKAEPVPMPSRIVVSLPFTAPDEASLTARTGRKARAVEGALRPVPSVYGLSARQAARTLYAAGFHVSVIDGANVRTRPEAGAMLRTGSTVQLELPK